MFVAPGDLTVPVGTTAATRAVLSGALSALLKELPSLASYPVLRPVVRALSDALRREPGPVFSALRRPTVGTAIRILRGKRDPQLATQLAATLAAELSAAGSTLPDFELDVPSEICCIGARRLLPGGRVTVADRKWRTGDAEIDLSVPAEDGPYYPIDETLLLATVDDNPLAMDEAHPDKDGNAIDLGGRSASEWVASLKDALDRIQSHLPLVREEAQLVLSQIVPVGSDDHRHLSASYAEAIGTIYCSLHPDPMTMTEALIHELSHNKLNALFEQGPLLENAFHPLFTSPVRPDPRPLHGVLLAVHAFVPVEVLYRAMREAGEPLSKTPGFERRAEQVRAKNREGAAVVLDNAIPTALGRPMLDELRRLIADLDG